MAEWRACNAGSARIWPAVRHLRATVAIGCTVLHPYRRIAAPPPGRRIRRWTGPGWTVVERHEIEVRAAPEQALDALRWIRLGELPAVRALLALRGLRVRPEATLRSFFTTSPFVLLEEVVGRALVCGVLIPPKRPTDRELPTTAGAFVAASVRAPLSAVIGFSAEPSVTGALLVTETLAKTSGARARALFASYWLAVGPWSAWIRRIILRAARARAEEVRGAM
jgi:hypothetical protein